MGEFKDQYEVLQRSAEKHADKKADRVKGV